MPSLGFEPTISADERPQTHALDRAATGTGELTLLYLIFKLNCYFNDNTPYFHYKDQLVNGIHGNKNMFILTVCEQNLDAVFNNVFINQEALIFIWFSFLVIITEYL